MIAPSPQLALREIERKLDAVQQFLSFGNTVRVTLLSLTAQVSADIAVGVETSLRTHAPDFATVGKCSERLTQADLLMSGHSGLPCDLILDDLCSVYDELERGLPVTRSTAEIVADFFSHVMTLAAPLQELYSAIPQHTLGIIDTLRAHLATSYTADAWSGPNLSYLDIQTLSNRYHDFQYQASKLVREMLNQPLGRMADIVGALVAQIEKVLVAAHTLRDRLQLQLQALETELASPKNRPKKKPRGRRPKAIRNDRIMELHSTGRSVKDIVLDLSKDYPRLSEDAVRRVIGRRKQPQGI